MKKFLLLVLISSPTFLLAQVTISGKVSDKKNPLQGASISLKDTYDGAITDSLGRFSFKTSEKGEQTLIVSSIGYKPFEQKITIEKTNLNFDVILKEEITDINPVLVTSVHIQAN